MDTSFDAEREGFFGEEKGICVRRGKGCGNDILEEKIKGHQHMDISRPTGSCKGVK